MSELMEKAFRSAYPDAEFTVEPALRLLCDGIEYDYTPGDGFLRRYDCPNCGRRVMENLNHIKVDNRGRVWYASPLDRPRYWCMVCLIVRTGVGQYLRRRMLSGVAHCLAHERELPTDLIAIVSYLETDSENMSEFYRTLAEQRTALPAFGWTGEEAGGE